MSALKRKAKCIEWISNGEASGWKETQRSFYGLESLFRLAFDVCVCACVFAKHMCELNITDEWRRTAAFAFFFLCVPCRLNVLPTKIA